MAEMADDTAVFEGAALGGDEHCCSVFTNLPAVELTMLGDRVGTGLAAGMNLAPLEPLLECGGIGLWTRGT
jgi:hypothetical protein